ncbi:hypothetical protein SeMB42_g04946 [Synchytrium endobioticum]|uniref:Uncharacterized protein n=1 Tax=Synchytrium endobioticum TaxID=286115 RepID=A0A507CUQ7_9FUNG|nr:hypothetical protein SeMB42_g04946 [Synchytrium endobioticum]
MRYPVLSRRKALPDSLDNSTVRALKSEAYPNKSLHRSLGARFIYINTTALLEINNAIIDINTSAQERAHMSATTLNSSRDQEDSHMRETKQSNSPRVYRHTTARTEVVCDIQVFKYCNHRKRIQNHEAYLSTTHYNYPLLHTAYATPNKSLPYTT